MTARIRQARARLLLDHPFFGTLALKLPPVEDKGVRTAAVDGTRIRYNPQWCATLTDAELEGLLAHEVMHVANGHCWRRDGRDQAGWNLATDYAINSILQEAGVSLPDEEHAAIGYPGPPRAAEAIYAELPQTPGNAPAEDSQDDRCKDADSAANAPGSGATGPSETHTNSQSSSPTSESDGTPDIQGSPDVPGVPEDDSQGGPDVPDPGGCGAVEDAPGDGTQEEEWRVAVAQAYSATKGMGKLPRGMERMVQEIICPSVPWTVLLRDFVEHSARNDYNWTHPNPRYLSSGIVMPSLVSEELQDVVLVMDTSGSIGSELLEKFSSEVSAVLGCYDATIHVLFCDSAVRTTESLTRADLPLHLKPAGGGGTDFRPAFRWVEEQDISPSCLIYLTDLLGCFPEEEPDYPVLWVSWSNIRDVPFGQVVAMD